MGFRPGPGRGACESAVGPTRDGGDRSGFAVWHEIEGGPPAQPTLEAFSEPGPLGDAVLAESAPPQNLREAAAIVGTIEPSRSDYHPHAAALKDMRAAGERGRAKEEKPPVRFA